MDIQNTGNASGVEIVNCIKEAGLSPDIADLSQLAGAVKRLGGLSREEIQAMIDAAVERVSPYKLCEFYFFRNPALRPGFQPAQGDLLENAAALHPEAWAYLQTEEGQALCVTEEEWQAMTHATWATLADGTKVGWDGIGGAPFFALHTDTGALRLPDIRGMYAEAAGFDDLNVGGVHGDAIRNITGKTHASLAYGFFASGAFTQRLAAQAIAGGGAGNQYYWSDLDASCVVPTAAKNQPRAWGALPCVYLGNPA